MAKICMVAAQHPIDDSRVYDQEAHTLAEHGHDVCIIARSVKGAKIDLPYYTVPNGRLSSIWWAFKYALKVDADVYHCHDLFSYPVGWLMKLRGKKVIFDIHERYELYLHPDAEVSLLGRFAVFIYILLLLLFGWFVDGYILAYDSLLWYRMFGKPVAVVYNFPRIVPVNKPRRLGKPIKLVYAGILWEERGIFLFPELVRRLLDKGYDVELHVYGKFKTSNDKERFFRLVDQHGVADKIIFHGSVPRNQLLRELPKYDVGLNLIRPTRTNRYTLQRKMLEYLAFGIPVIGTKGIYYFEKLVAEKGAGVAVEFGNLDALEEALLQIITAYDDMSARALNLADKYSWTVETDKLMSFYSSLRGSS